MSRSSRFVSEASAVGIMTGIVGLTVMAEISSWVQTGGTSFMSALAAVGLSGLAILGSMGVSFHGLTF